ncbi:hypothetical protein N1F78_06275 [Seonamhaeicola sp. MEBiC1930]|uniref:hypothetical protein n=1 Tax=Seonamhaeicola sp. MEBiC01930 TaxID=2976768 RepID=UPI0032527DF8
MKRLIVAYIFFTLTIMGCEKRKNHTSVHSDVISEVRYDEFKNWEFRGIEMSKVNEQFQGEDVYNLSVVDHIETFTFVAINNIKIRYTGGKYRITFFVKPINEYSNYGIRVQEVYPTRLDAVFDFASKTVRGVYKNGEFTNNEKLKIKPEENGWFECVLELEIKASYFRLLFGPTDVVENQVKSWESEALNKKSRGLLIVPSKIKIEELKL